MTAWLLFVLAMLVWVVARQTSAVVAAAELDSLKNQRSLLEAQRAQLQRRIRSAESRAVLIPHAESLGLRLPADSEIVILSAPAGEGR